MDGFNLLPEQFRTRRAARFVPISALATFTVIILFALLMELEINVLPGRRSGAMLHATLVDRQRDLAQVRAERVVLEKEIEQIVTVLPHTPIWSNLLIDTASAVGNDLWIDHWVVDTERGLCSIQGRAQTNDDVFAFVASLEQIAVFESVTLTGVTKESGVESEITHYEILCRLHQAAR